MSSRKSRSNQTGLGKPHVKATIIALLAATFLASCTKSVPYDQVFKEDVHNKNEIDEKAEYLYVASSDNSSSDNSGASAAQPFFQGEPELIKFRFTEKSLQAVQIVKDNRLKKNGLNEKILLEIPIQHLQYRCAEDRYGKCTNKEEENSEINWSKKTQFKPDLNSLKTLAPTIIPLEMEKVFGSSCYTEVASVLRKYEITKDAVNIQLTKTYSADLSCLSRKGISVPNLSDLQSQLVQHFSFTKLDKVASKGYKAAIYPRADEDQFGFFTTDDNKLDVDYGSTESGKTQLMARWNPAKTEIVYYLSDNFDKPEFAAIKKSTQVAFDRINAGLKAAKIQTRLVLKDPAHKDPGDARYSMIVMVEDPVSSGPLGYGPSVKDPRTGEILSARTVMYYGNILSSIKSTYDEIVLTLRRREMKDVAVSPANIQALNDKTNASKRLNNSIVAPINKEIKEKYALAKSQTQARSQKMDLGGMTTKSLGSAQSLAQMSRAQFSKALQVSDRTLDEDNIMGAMSKHCTYPSEYVDFDAAIKTALNNKLGPNLKFWLEMNESERQAIVDIVAPVIWLPTLIHELGHNLGLRHNFKGSEDKDNFYSKEELAKMNVQHEIPYSSVMDYGYSELNLLPTLGKYDIAALRFAYNREVELKDGTIVPVNTTIKDLLKKPGVKLKDYGYCSDESVETNAGCKRFDKGTNPVEIVTFLVEQYDKMYLRRNFRNDRESFSVYDDGAYARGRRSNFNYIRAFMESHERIKSMFGLKSDAPEWENIPWLKEVKQAAIISGRFFIDVMTMPDVTCAVLAPPDGTSTEPQVIIGELREIDSSAMSCFDVAWKEGFKLIGQGGKFFQHKKSPKSENIYADQIDVRGTYIDKILAAEYLFKRKIGNSIYDKNEDNYLDLTQVSEEITNAVNGILIGNMTRKVTFKNQAGIEVLTKEIPVSLLGLPDQNAAGELQHWIPSSLSKDAAAMLKLPDYKISYQQMLLNIIDSSMKNSQSHWLEDRSFADNYRIIKTNTAYQVDRGQETVSTDIGNVRLIAQKQNSASNQFASIYNYALLIDKLSDDDFKKFYEERTRVTKDIDGVVVRNGQRSSFGAAYDKIPLNLAVAYRQGQVSKEVYEYLLTILPAANY